MSKQIHDESRRESGRRMQVRYRVDADLLESYDAWVDESDHESRSAALRQAMRRDINGGTTRKTPRVPPTDNETLHVAYLKLCDIANADGVIRHDLAEEELSTTLGKRKQAVRHQVLGKLRNRGYLARAANVYGDRSWKLRGWDS